MIPWATGFIAKPMVKQFGPYALGLLLVALVIAVPYFVGRSHGGAKWEARYDKKVIKLAECTDTANHNANEVVKLRTEIEDTNSDIAKMEHEGREQEERNQARYEQRLRDKDRYYQKAIAERDREAAELLKRMQSMTVAEACHEAWRGLGGGDSGF